MKNDHAFTRKLEELESGYTGPENQPGEACHTARPYGGSPAIVTSLARLKDLRRVGVTVRPLESRTAVIERRRESIRLCRLVGDHPEQIRRLLEGFPELYDEFRELLEPAQEKEPQP